MVKRVLRVALAYALVFAGIGGMLYAFYVLVPLPWFILIASFVVYAIGYNLRERAIRVERAEREVQRPVASKTERGFPAHLN